jgi:acetoin utilization protein AcuC
VARAWTGVWGLLSGRDIPVGIPVAGVEVPRAAGWTMEEDDPYVPALFASRLDAVLPSPVRTQLRELATRALVHPFLSASH